MDEHSYQDSDSVLSDSLEEERQSFPCTTIPPKILKEKNEET